MKRLAIIGGGRMAGIFAKNAKEMNIETHCFSQKNGICEPSLFDYIHDVDILDKNKLLNICKKLKINGVVCTTELTIAPAAYVAEKMKLNGITYDVACEITNKFRNREKTKYIKDLYHPKYSEIYTIDDIKNLGFDYPIILKPTSKGGKRGITVINNVDEIQEAYEYAVKDTNNSLPFIVEEFISGEMECSVESLSYKGTNYIIQITEKITSGAPHCVELAHHQPANISNKLRKKVEEVINQGLKSIGMINGACHTEIKIKNDNIYLIEFNARPGGDHIAYPLTFLSTGYPYIKGAIEIALNIFEPVDYSSFKNYYSGVVFVTKQTLKYKKLFEECEKYDWCYMRNFVSDSYESIIHNDGFNKNYFIYCSNSIPDFLVNEAGEI